MSCVTEHGDLSQVQVKRGALRRSHQPMTLEGIVHREAIAPSAYSKLLPCVGC